MRLRSVYRSLRTHKNFQGEDILDISHLEFTSIHDLVEVVLKVCERYNTWDYDSIPDILKMSTEQRNMFPPDIYIMNSPFNVMEIQSPGVDNTLLDNLGSSDNNDLLTT